MCDTGLADLWIYLKTAPPFAEHNVEQELTFPFSLRTLIPPRRWLYFGERRVNHDPGRSEVWNRGAYRSNTLGHCGEYHTQHNLLAGLNLDRPYASNTRGPQVKGIPTNTPHPKRALAPGAKAKPLT